MENNDRNMIEVEGEIPKSEKRKKVLSKIITIILGIVMLSTTILRIFPGSFNNSETNSSVNENIENETKDELEISNPSQSQPDKTPEDIVISDEKPVSEKPKLTLEEEISAYKIIKDDEVITFKARDIVDNTENKSEETRNFECSLEFMNTKTKEIASYPFDGEYFKKENYVELEKNTEINMFMRFVYHYYLTQAENEIGEDIDTSTKNIESSIHHSDKETIIEMKSDFYKTMTFTLLKNSKYEYDLKITME